MGMEGLDDRGEYNDAIESFLETISFFFSITFCHFWLHINTNIP
jgi:hypothetical protein